MLETPQKQEFMVLPWGGSLLPKFIGGVGNKLPTVTNNKNAPMKLGNVFLP